MTTKPNRSAVDPRDARSTVVLLLGMRINAWRRVDQWLPIIRGMAAMTRELRAEPALGLLHAESYWLGRRFIDIQYWRDLAALDGYIRDETRLHLPAWRSHTPRGPHPAVGFYHEIYALGTTPLEAIYRDMEPAGLGAALGARPIDHTWSGREGLRGLRQR